MIGRLPNSNAYTCKHERHYDFFSLYNKNKDSPNNRTVLNSISILLLFDDSLRLAPSCSGVAAASQILCISTALNKRKYFY